MARPVLHSLRSCGLSLIALAILACTDPPIEQNSGATERPSDVVLVTLDTTRPDHLGPYGYPRPSTPELDAFADDGVVFERAWSTAPWTLPSHASMFTGQYPTTHGARFNPEGEDMWANKVTRLPESATTVAEVLREKGYATAAMAGGPWLAPEFGLLQGFETTYAGLPDGRSLLAPEPKGKAQFKIRVNFPADDLTDRAISWLRALPADEPAHLFINYFDPHAPYVARKGHRMPGEPAVDSDDPDIVADVNKYDAEIHFMDRELGRLFQELREQGRYDDALIIVTADHGEAFGEHGNRYHGPWLYEDLMRVPLIVKFPANRDAGSRSQVLASGVDLFPLIAAETGISMPEGVEGVALGERDLVIGEAFRSNAFNMIHPGRHDADLLVGIRWPWKMIIADTGTIELYDLARDPDELADETAPEVRAPLEGSIRSVRDEMRPPATKDFAKGVDPELQERLRKLGYTR